ncbi:ROK family protein [Rugosimonospora africana]|uniref:ROK family protein n=1 Tax=Rugosimonospora africana TaxID=556532 RepID=UPI0019450BD8|nr:ROK family protein [Rugosimonospora africana]
MDSGTAVRRSNRSSVLEQLLSGREIDRQELVAATGLSQATVFRVVSELLESRILVEGPTITRAGRGRNATSVRFNGEIALACGVDLGGTNCRLVLTDALGRTIARRNYRTRHDVDARGFGEWLGSCVRELVEQDGANATLGAVTVGLPGAVAGDKTRVVGSQNLPQIRGPEFLVALRGSLDAPVNIDNDSNLALLGELRYGSVPPTETTVLLILGTGLSAAVAMDGEILSGAQGLLGELGRLPLLGREQRLRDLLSGAGLAGYGRSLGYTLDTTAEVFAQPQRFGPLVADSRAAFTHLIDIVALAYEPASILVTGGFSESFTDDWFADTRARLRDLVGVDSVIQRSTLGAAAGLLGAMAHALSHLHIGLGALGALSATVGPGRDEILERFRSYSPETLASGV